MSKQIREEEAISVTMSSKIESIFKSIYNPTKNTESKDNHRVITVVGASFILMQKKYGKNNFIKS